MTMTAEVLKDTEPNKLLCVVTQLENGVARLSAHAAHDDDAPGLSSLSYPLSASLADLIDAAGYRASRFALGLVEAMDDLSYRATLWRVLSMAGIGVICLEYARSKALAMLVSTALCMATPPVFQIGQASDDRWYPLPSQTVALEA